MKLQGKKVLVTGADGFIGSHLTEHLVALGVDVRAFVYYNSFNSWGWLDEADTQIKQSLDVLRASLTLPTLTPSRTASPRWLALDCVAICWRSS